MGFHFSSIHLWNCVTCIGNHMYLSTNCMSNSQVIARRDAECNFDWYKYNYSLIAHKYMQLPINHIALPMTFYPYSKDCHEFQWRITYQSCCACIVRYSISMIKRRSSTLKGYTALITSRLYSFL